MSTRRLKHIGPLVGLLGVFGFGVLPCHWTPAAHAQTLPPDRASAVQEVRVTLSEWALTPARISVPVGRTIRFLVVNAGVLPHALTVEGAGVFGETETIGAGGTAPLDITFKLPGTYDVYCPVNAGQHRDLGQEGTLVVLPATGALVLPRTGEPEVIGFEAAGVDTDGGVDFTQESLDSFQ